MSADRFQKSTQISGAMDENARRVDADPDVAIDAFGGFVET